MGIPTKPRKGAKEPFSLSALPPTTSDGRPRFLQPEVPGYVHSQQWVHPSVWTPDTKPEFRVVETSVDKPTAKGVVVTPTMNATEQRWADQLEADRLAGRVLWWKFGAIRLWLGDGAWYKADFFSMRADRVLVVDETKGGFAREASKVRFKVAASMYPFVFRWCVWEKGAWSITTPHDD